ncbi:uncharacterized protein MONBRDRAFT_39155 [Monosiga brevicollis MX1]|uniref:Basic leucine zipper domain-containing protein n=1 Tax=Monosiga brevicollis TaxID=81824 RepID=A9VCK6_MONBE|nr:uncharacterized protein MONBRDRAFT_39155 [Monosiga brevicollis MX1]EDQ84765.1 predicted protein [Monosiga brevicollis MX1]|eukprot:XP_001750415.1 hypothetical protein [Monosiga brevicollis MX1]
MYSTADDHNGSAPPPQPVGSASGLEDMPTYFSQLGTGTEDMAGQDTDFATDMKSLVADVDLINSFNMQPMDTINTSTAAAAAAAASNAVAAAAAPQGHGRRDTPVIQVTPPAASFAPATTYNAWPPSSTSAAADDLGSANAHAHVVDPALLSTMHLPMVDLSDSVALKAHSPATSASDAMFPSMAFNNVNAVFGHSGANLQPSTAHMDTTGPDFPNLEDVTGIISDLHSASNSECNSEWSDVTSEGTHSSLHDSEHDLEFSGDEGIRRQSGQFLSVPLRQRQPKPAVSTVPSKYAWPTDVLEMSRAEFTKLTHSQNLTEDQIADLRMARRRHKNRRYQKGARVRRRERRERGEVPHPQSPAQMRRDLNATTQQLQQASNACTDLLSALRTVPGALQVAHQVANQHPFLQDVLQNLS